MIERNTPESALNERQGVDKLPTVNPYISTLPARKAQKPMSTEEYVQGIREGNRTILSRAITLIESTLPEHQRQAQEIIEQCLPYSGNSFRLGITGVPGAGKSTFINTLGLHLARTGKKLAVLAIDPSSERTKGSILGDKTRMDELACQENVFIRPSPSAGSLGGVARKTRESVILCEAAGFTHIIIETVGVGQSETEAYNMVDYFLLLQLANLGDELQGIKRGIMEMADGIAINKAEGDFRPKALLAQTQLRNALQLFPPTASGWKPSVEICSAKINEGVTEVWSVIEEFERFCKQNGSFERRRREQLKKVLQNSLQENILAHFFAQPDTEKNLEEAREQVYNYKVNPYTAAQKLAETYFGVLEKVPASPVTPPMPQPATPKPAPKPVRADIPHFEHALAVDAACAGNPGKMEYQGVQVN
ncbi:MAG: methylmalonyl Co-A mutase-associated GTPase MeaB, partial [Bacteroidales bacterium]|nr:methylmalonyl Co-A mutase-associated GTPase MeaB [Bacteroidales bacterium]